MNFCPGKSAAAPMLMLGAAMRMFYGLSIDSFSAHNAAWLCPLIGLLLCLPLAFAVSRAAGNASGSCWDVLAGSCPAAVLHVLEAVFCLLLIYDGCVTARLAASIVGTMALNGASVYYLMLPPALLVFAVSWLGAEAAGNGVRIWIHLLPLLFVVLIAVQLKSYRAAWLMPVLGGGTGALIDNGICCGGWMALLFLGWPVALPDRRKGAAWPLLLLSAGIAAALLALSHMLYPTLNSAELSRASRLELILGNGRVAVSLQLILTLLWYGSLFHLLSSEAVLSAVYLRRLAPRLPQPVVSGVLAVILYFGASGSYTGRDASNLLARYLYIGIAALLLIPLIVRFFGKGGKTACEKSAAH